MFVSALVQPRMNVRMHTPVGICMNTHPPQKKRSVAMNIFNRVLQKKSSCLQLPHSVDQIRRLLDPKDMVWWALHYERPRQAVLQPSDRPAATLRPPPPPQAPPAEPSPGSETPSLEGQQGISPGRDRATQIDWSKISVGLRSKDSSPMKQPTLAARRQATGKVDWSKVGADLGDGSAGSSPLRAGRRLATGKVDWSKIGADLRARELDSVEVDSPQTSSPGRVVASTPRSPPQPSGSCSVPATLSSADVGGRLAIPVARPQRHRLSSFKHPDPAPLTRYSKLRAPCATKWRPPPPLMFFMCARGIWAVHKFLSTVSPNTCRERGRGSPCAPKRQHHST